MELTNVRTIRDFSDTIALGRVIGTVENIDSDIIKIIGSIFYNDDKIDFQVFPMDDNVGCNIQGAIRDNITIVLDIIKTEINDIKQHLSL